MKKPPLPSPLQPVRDEALPGGLRGWLEECAKVAAGMQVGRCCCCCFSLWR